MSRKKGLAGEYIISGNKCWLHFNTSPGQTQSGDYAYLKAYAKDRSEKVEDKEIFVRVIIKEIVWKYTHIAFNCQVLSAEGKELWGIQVYEPGRLTLCQKEKK